MTTLTTLLASAAALAAAAFVPAARADTAGEIKNVVLCTAASSTAPAGGASTTS